MKRVLFVDDEPNVLDGLRRMLYGMRREWRMSFFSSSANAIAALDDEDPDVVVSDMKMPGIDGAQLLEEVKQRHPRSVRIILSGESDQRSILRCLGTTHVYLAKPCDPEELKTAIQRAESCRDLLRNDSLKGLISQLDSLPSLPTLFEELVAEVSDSEASLRRIGEIVSQDIGMSAKLVQVVNSAYFGLKIPITSVPRAVAFLGLEAIHTLALTASIFSQYDGVTVPGFDPAALWKHSVRTGICAKTIAERIGFDPRAIDDVALAALLHDSGKLVLAANLPAKYAECLRLVADHRGSLSAAEKEVLGSTHAEVGAYVMGLWGFPDSIIEAIAYHARPLEAPVRETGLVTVVHIANGLAEDSDGSAVDRDYLTALRIEDRLPDWQENCRALLESGGERE